MKGCTGGDVKRGRGAEGQRGRERHVVLVPILADEHDHEMLYDLKRETQAVPEWSWP
jgi:hypothetical protein